MPSLHRESTDSLIITLCISIFTYMFSYCLFKTQSDQRIEDAVIVSDPKQNECK